MVKISGRDSENKSGVLDIMSSLAAKIFNLSSKIFMRRQSWGRDEYELARRVRRWYGAPKILQWWKSRGLRIEKIDENGIRGEWIAMPDARHGGVIFYLHGGGYVSCSAATHRPITTTLARLTGLRVFSLDYRLAPEDRFPAASDDAIRAYRRLIEREKIPASKIVFAGDSAGGGLVLVTILRARDENLPLPAGAVCFSPWTDLTGSGASVLANSEDSVMFRRQNIHDFARAYLGDAAPVEIYASPLFGNFADFPPTLIHAGSTEMLFDDARRVHEKIVAANGDSCLKIFEDVPHCWQMLDGFVPESRESLQLAADFINRRING